MSVTSDGYQHDNCHLRDQGPSSLGSLTTQSIEQFAQSAPSEHSRIVLSSTLQNCSSPSIDEADNVGNLGQSSAIQSIISPRPNQAFPPCPAYAIFPIDGKYYVSAEMPIPAQAAEIWREGLKQRLECALDPSSKARHDSEVALQLEFYMAGKRKSNLKPSILITCCSSRRKKELKSCLGKLKWLKDSGLPYYVRVDKTCGLRMDHSPGSNIIEPIVEAKIMPGTSTICGIPARVRSNQESDQEWVKLLLEASYASTRLLDF